MKQLQYDEWLKYIKNEIQLLLPKDVGYQVQLDRRISNNGTSIDSVIIRRDNEAVSPAIRLKQYYDFQLSNQCSITAAAQMVVNDYQDAMQDNNVMQLNDMREDLHSLSWDFVKDKVFLRLISTEKNMELLRTTPYETFGDMALVARIKMLEMKDGIGTALVDNKVLDQMGIDKESLFEQAKENTPKLFPAKIENMAEKMLYMMYGSNPPEEAKAMLEETNEMPMYVVSNAYGMDGAAAVTYPGIEAQLKELLGGDFLLLPSSVHEFLAIKRTDIPVEAATEMVHEANATAVDAADFLSESVYTLKNGECINLTREMELENSISSELDNMQAMDEGMDLEM